MNSPEHGEVSDEAMLEKGNFCNLYTVHLQQLKLQLKLKKCHQAYKNIHLCLYSDTGLFKVVG